MSEPNFAGNIIVNLASLPDFLRTPILKKRMTEFFSKNDEDKSEIIVNALNAGPTIPFPNFSKLFRTIFEIFLQVDSQKQEVLISSIKTVFDRLDEESKRKMRLLAPDSAKELFNF